MARHLAIVHTEPVLRAGDWWLLLEDGGFLVGEHTVTGERERYMSAGRDPITGAPRWTLLNPFGCDNPYMRYIRLLEAKVWPRDPNTHAFHADSE